MKLITLNTWGARVKEPFRKFIKKNKDVDVFCFQEIYDKAEEVMKDFYPETNHNLYSELQSLLPEHNSFFRPALAGVYGICIFIKKNIEIIEEGDLLIHKNQNESKNNMDGHHDRNLQWIELKLNEKNLTIVNVHGLWNGKGKTDTDARIKQSSIIKKFIDSKSESKILCGDFNLNPDTESVKILEKGMKNLINDYSITSTRTSLYEKPGKFADYVFTSPDIEVKDFKVLPDEVSDHSALLLEI